MKHLPLILDLAATPALAAEKTDDAHYTSNFDLTLAGATRVVANVPSIPSHCDQLSQFVIPNDDEATGPFVISDALSIAEGVTLKGPIEINVCDRVVTITKPGTAP
jgi:hypothetical protein